MKVHLRKRKLRSKNPSKPRYSLYLDIYYRKGKRKREFLGIYLDPNDEASYRNEKLKLAENIKAKRMMELANEAHGFPTKEKLNQNFIVYFEKQMDKREGNSKIAWSNLDNVFNIFSLCPNCHRAIHYSTPGKKRELLNILYDKRSEIHGYKFSIITELYNCTAPEE